MAQRFKVEVTHNGVTKKKIAKVGGGRHSEETLLEHYKKHKVFPESAKIKITELVPDKTAANKQPDPDETAIEERTELSQEELSELEDSKPKKKKKSSD